MTYESPSSQVNVRQNRVTVILNAGPMQRQMWAFWLEAETLTLWLELYADQARPSTRARWQDRGLYYRINSRGSTLQVDDVPLPQAVQLLARKAVFSRLAVKKRTKSRTT